MGFGGREGEDWDGKGKGMGKEKEGREGKEEKRTEKGRGRMKEGRERRMASLQCLLRIYAVDHSVNTLSCQCEACLTVKV